jgi:hypothetical protein
MKRRIKLITAIATAVAVTTAVAIAASTPSVVTGSATSVTNTTADIHGTVNPGGSGTTYFFQWGVSPAYGLQSPSHSAGSGTKTINVATVPTNLIPGTVYHYRVVASNRFGAALGRDRAFTTTGHPPAVVITGPPFEVAHSFAILTGSVNPEGAPTGWAFQYGTTPAYGVQSFGGALPASNSLQGVHETISGLSDGTTFHYRLIAVHGTTVVSYGADQTFTTLPFPPRRPALHAFTTPHRAQSKPYLFTTTGSLTLPSSIPPNAGCNGVVAVRFFVSKHSKALGETFLRPDCTFVVQVLFHGLIGRSRPLEVQVRFRGNPYLVSVSARPQRVRLG